MGRSHYVAGRTVAVCMKLEYQLEFRDGMFKILGIIVILEV